MEQAISSIPPVAPIAATTQPDPTQEVHRGHGGGHGKHGPKRINNFVPEEAERTESKPAVRRPTAELIQRLKERQEEESPDKRRQRYATPQELEGDGSQTEGGLVDLSA